MTAVAAMVTAMAGVAALAAKGTATAMAMTHNDGDNGSSCNSDGDDDSNDAGNYEEDSHDNYDMTVVTVRAVGARKTTTVIAMAGGTNNSQLKAQVCPAHDGNKDDMPEMCLAVVAVAAMMVWEGGAQWQW